jgi:hypothetical protein
MIIKFSDAGINLADYNGYSFEKIRPLIINQVADYILEYEDIYDYEVFNSYEWEIDYVQQLVIIPEYAFV